MTAQPGADELRIREILRRRQVGPDAVTPPAAAPKSAVRSRDWLDEILDAPRPPAPAPAQTAPGVVAKRPTSDTKKRKPKRRRRRARGRNPDAPRTAWDTRPPHPRQSLIEAWDRIPYRLKWLGSHLAAAAAGWRLGILDWATDTTAWYAAGHWTSPSAWVLYALGVCCAALYRRARRWAWPVAWAATVPVSSVVVGVLLFGTGYHP
jgi:hypothetical protein